MYTYIRRYNISIRFDRSPHLPHTILSIKLQLSLHNFSAPSLAIIEKQISARKRALSLSVRAFAWSINFARRRENKLAGDRIADAARLLTRGRSRPRGVGVGLSRRFMTGASAREVD